MFKNIHTLAGNVTDLMKEYDLPTVNICLNSDVAEQMRHTTLWKTQHLNFFRHSVNQHFDGPCFRVQVNKPRGEMICIVEKRVVPHPDDGTKLIIRHLNEHPGRAEGMQETHTTVIDNDFSIMVQEIKESVETTIESLIRLYDHDNKPKEE